MRSIRQTCPLYDLATVDFTILQSIVVTLADAGTSLSERVIKEIHSFVLMNDRQNRGVYRSVPVTILGTLHTQPQPYLVLLVKS